MIAVLFGVGLIIYGVSVGDVGFSFAGGIIVGAVAVAVAAAS